MNETPLTEEVIETPNQSHADTFNAELEKLGIDPKTGNDRFDEANDVAQRGDPRTATEKVAEEKAKTEDGIPDEILHGKKEEKKTEVDPFVAEPPQELKGKSREHFKNLQTQAGQKITSLSTELERTKAEIAELKKNGSGPGEDVTKELETLRAQKKEIEDEFERIAVERSPKFKQKFVPREQSLKSQAVKILKLNGSDETLFDQALVASEKKKWEILNSEDLNESQKGALSSLMIQYDMVQDEKNSELENRKEYLKEEQQQEEAARKAKIEAQERQEQEIFDVVGKKVAAEFEPFMEVEGNDAWNAQVKENREKAKNFFAGKGTLDEMAEIAYYGIGAKSLHKMFRNVQAKYNALAAENQKLKGVNPSINGNHQAPKEEPKNEKPEDRWMRTFAEELRAVNQG